MGTRSGAAGSGPLARALRLHFLCPHVWEGGEGRARVEAAEEARARPAALRGRRAVLSTPARGFQWLPRTRGGWDSETRGCRDVGTLGSREQGTWAQADAGMWESRLHPSRF